MVVGRCVPRERASEVASVRACNAHGLCLSLCAAADTAAKLFSHGSALLPLSLFVPWAQFPPSRSPSLLSPRPERRDVESHACAVADVI